MRRAFLAGALAAGALVAVPAAVAQAATPCTGLIANQTINGSLAVPAGAGCVLSGDRVNGSITIASGAAFSLGYAGASSGNTVTGSIDGTGIQAFDSWIPTSTVDGSIDLTGVTGVPDAGPLAPLGLAGIITDTANYFDGLDIDGATTIKSAAAGAPFADDRADDFGGAFTYTGNAGGLFLYNGDTVGGALSVHGNTGGGLLEDLTVGGSLLCGNTPLFATSANTVSGFNAGSGGTC